MNKKLVRFANGKWGVRHGLFFHVFQDFRHPQFLWAEGCQFFNDCQTDEETARSFLNPIPYEIVK